METPSKVPKRRPIELGYPSSVAASPRLIQHHKMEDDSPPRPLQSRKMEDDSSPRLLQYYKTEDESRNAKRKFPFDSRSNALADPGELLDVRVYLPNRTHVDFQMQRRECGTYSIRNLVERIQIEECKQECKLARMKQRSIIWGPHATIEDFEGNCIGDGAIPIQDSSTGPSVILLLQDGHHDSIHGHPDLWNVTPEAHVLEVLPQDYTLFSALADEIDNSLQAVWQLEKGKRRLVSVTLEEGKITIFDTGKGMDSSPGHSIAKWGTLGSSSSRFSVKQGVGGEPPYLKPYFGMYGFGGIGAGLHLGGSITVSSKTVHSRIVAVLHLRGQSLKNDVKSGSTWKTPGEIRKPTEEELKTSTHGSFTKVEISDLNRVVSTWKVEDVQRKLKDFYSPYIQNDESAGSSSKTARPVEILVNGMDLAEVLGGEVTITNRFTGVGNPFVLLLEFSKGQAPSKSDAEQGHSTIDMAHARITCHYFPITKGKEALEEVLEHLRAEDPESEEETFDTFSRVSIRRLGRLLPDARTRRLPFMDRRKGPRCNDVSKEAFKRVKAFVDVDAGFVPTTSKMDLSAKHVFTEALMNLGGTSKSANSAGTPKSLKAKGGVTMVITALTDGSKGKVIQPEQLRSEYADWVQTMHRRFDIGATFDDNASNDFIITTERHRKEPLNIKNDAFLVEYNIKCRDIEWAWGGKKQRPVRLKLLKGLPGLNNEYQIYVTVECVIRDDYPENPRPPGDTKLICRPIDVSPEMGSRVVYGNEADFMLGKSRVFPIDILFCREKFEDISENEAIWQKQLKKLRDLLPSHVELLSEIEGLRFDIEGDIVNNCLLQAGESLPPEVIAVVRPRLSKLGTSKGQSAGKNIPNSRSEQKFIIAKSMEMSLTVAKLDFRPPNEPVRGTERGTEIYISPRAIKPTTRNNVSGLYCIKTAQVSDLIMTKTGTYLLKFKLLGDEFKDVSLTIRVNVAASEKEGRWKICSHAGDCNVEHPGLLIPCLHGRLGEVLDWNIVLSRYDEFNNPVKLSKNKELSDIYLELQSPAGEYLDVQPAIPKDFKLEDHISPDHFSLEIPKIKLSGGDLAPIAPTHQASLCIFIAKQRAAEFKFTVRPGFVTRAEIKENEAPVGPLRPGQVIDRLIFQCMDKYGNPAEKGEDINLALEGLKLYNGKGGSTKQVDGSSCVDLGGRLKVIARYGESASVELRNARGTQRLVEVQFEIMKRQLRILNNPNFTPAGSKLGNIKIEAVDGETGIVDEEMDGTTYALALGWNAAVCVPLKKGRCTLPEIQLPNKPESWTGKVSLAEHPEIRTLLRVEILEPTAANNTLSAVEDPHELPTVQVGRVLEASTIRLQELERKTRQRGRQQALMEEELEKHRKLLQINVERQAHYQSQLISLQGGSEFEDGNAGETHEAEVELDCYNSKKLISELGKLGEPPGTHATSFLLDAMKEDRRFVEGAGADIIGPVAILAVVESDSISQALANFLGEDLLTSIVCKSTSAIEFLGAQDTSRTLGLHGFAKGRNSRVSGSFGVILPDPESCYKRGDTEPAVNNDHPQKLLNMTSPTAASRTTPTAEGFVGYAVNLLHLHKDHTLHLKVGEYGLRETLFFNMFSYLQVYNTLENMMRAKEFIQTSAVSLDGGLLHEKQTSNYFKMILSKSPVIRFAVAPEITANEGPAHPIMQRLKVMQGIKKLVRRAEAHRSRISALEKELVQAKNRTAQLTQEMTREAAGAADLVAQINMNKTLVKREYE